MHSVQSFFSSRKDLCYIAPRPVKNQHGWRRSHANKRCTMHGNIFEKRSRTSAHLALTRCIPMTEVLGFRMIFHGGITTVTLSVYKLALSCVGIWPVKKKTLFMDLRWIIAVLLEASIR